MRTTKAQISLRICTVWSVPLLFATYNTSSCYIQNFKTLASLCLWAGQFESYLVANPEDRFCHDVAHKATEETSDKEPETWHYWMAVYGGSKDYKLYDAKVLFLVTWLILPYFP